MNATLNIYKDCSSEKPTKSYTCRRLLYGVSKKVQALSDNMKGTSEKEQEALTLDIIKTIFPNFEDDDFNYIDPQEWLKFVEDIGRETNQIVNNAAKK